MGIQCLNCGASTTQNIGCPSIMTPLKMGKTKTFIFYSLMHTKYYRCTSFHHVIADLILYIQCSEHKPCKFDTACHWPPLTKGHKLTLIICQLYSFVIGKRHVLSPLCYMWGYNFTLSNRRVTSRLFTISFCPIFPFFR